MNELRKNRPTTKTTVIGVALSLLLAACAAPPASAPSTATQAQPTSVPATDATEAPAAPAEAKPTEASQAVAGFPVTIKDRLGREFTFDKPVVRVVCIYSGCTRAFGAMNHSVVAVSELNGKLEPEFADASYYPGFAANVTLLPNPAGEIDAEAIAAFKPDLIVAYREEDIEKFKAIAPVFSEYDSYTLEQIADSLRNYGRMVGALDRAEAAIKRVTDRYEAYKKRAPGNVSFMTIGNEGSKLWLRTNNSSECTALQGLAECKWPDPTGGTGWSYEATSEAVLKLNPDVIYMANWSASTQTDQLLKAFLEDPLIQETNAAKNKRVYNVAGYDNPTANGAMALTKLLDVYMPLLYPDIFPAPLTDDEVQAILKGESASAAQPVAASVYPLVITDTVGRVLTFNAPPKRVISIDHGAFGALATLSIKPVGSAVSDEARANETYYFSDGKSIPSVRAADGNVDPERVAALKPDLIVGWSPDQDVLFKDIAPYYSIGGAVDVASYEQIVRDLGAILDVNDVADAAIRRFRNRVSAYAARAPGKPTVLKLSPDQGKSFWVNTVEDPACNVLALVMTCKWMNPDGSIKNYQTSLEGVNSLDPDVILVINWTGQSNSELKNGLDKEPLWQSLRAVQTGRAIFAENPMDLQGDSITGMNMVLDKMMPLLYPDVFPAPLTDEQVKEILGK